jgi:hypothetical protein
MTIMLAGGMVIAAPSMMPAAHAANANLFVSAENSLYNNYFGGAQVIEIVINDADLKETDEAKGEPDVTVNGKIVRMVQGVDGLWYAYITDKDTSRVADANQLDNGATAGTGLDFGKLCDRTSDVLGIDVSDSVGVWIPGVVDEPTLAGETDDIAPAQGVDGDVDVLPVCTPGTSGDGDAGTTEDPHATVIADNINNVVRESKDPSNNDDVIGQIDVAESAWPFIQTYDFNPTGNVIVQYNKGSNVQTTSLTFDTLDGYIDTAFDRSSWPPGAQVHLTISDMELNFDPTDEDSITFNIDGESTYYGLFDESGNNAGACDDFNTSPSTQCTEDGFNSVTPHSANIVPILGDLFFEDGGVMFIERDAQDAVATEDGEFVLEVDGNSDSFFDAFTTDTTTTSYVTVTELGPNSGVFATYDELDDSVLSINGDAQRGTSAIVEYDDTGYTILVANEFAVIDIQPIDDEWSSGEEIPVILFDDDQNLNSRFDEDLDLNNPDIPLIPSVKIGSPITMADVESVTIDLVPFLLEVDDESVIQPFSDRAMLVTSDTTGDLVFNDEVIIFTFDDAEDSLFAAMPFNDPDFQGFGALNYDIRSLANDGNLEDLDSVDVILRADGDEVVLAADTLDLGLQGVIVITEDDIDGAAIDDADAITVDFVLNMDETNEILSDTVVPVVVDFFGFGFFNDGVLASERVDNMIVRMELEETGDNTGEFEGSLEYVMLNQLNILDIELYEDLGTVADDPWIVVIEDFTDEDSIRVDYNDLGADGVVTPVGDQEEAPSHSGVVSFDLDTYKVADTVSVTLEDADLNVDSDLIEIYTIVSTDDDDANNDADTPAVETVGTDTDTVLSFGPLGSLLNITFDDQLWAAQAVKLGGDDDDGEDGISCTTEFDSFNDGFASTGFTLIETGTDSGVFTGDFQIPDNYCNRGSSSGSEASTTGTDIEVNYLDFRDASGEIIEVGDSAGIRANTGSVSLDRTVYPVPWGSLADFGDALTTNTPSGASLFPVHVTGVVGDIDDADDLSETLGNGDLTIHIRVNDPDFDISAGGSDFINGDASSSADPRGPVKITVSRGSDEVILAYAGGETTQTDGVIDVGNDGEVFDNNLEGDDRVLSFAVDIGNDGEDNLNVDGTDTGVEDDVDDDFPTLIDGDDQKIRLLGAIEEIAPDAGIFELDFNIRYTDGPASSVCPDTEDYQDLNGSGGTDVTDRFSVAPGTGENYCILQGDIITVEYTDPTDAAGDPNTVTDSATFDLRNGVLQSDKSVYIIGGDMILTIIEPDWDLDNDAAETYDLDIIEWDSDAATLSMGDLGGAASNDGLSFDPEPTDFRETGDSTGIFQIVIEIPEELDGDRLERGEEIVLEYTDWGPSGSDYVGQEDEDINVTVFTSNFGATVELDQKVYSWTDKVYITVVAPDHNFDSDLIDEVGGSSLDPIKISTRGHDINEYKLVETGTDTGIFTGEVILTGFEHDADGDADTGSNDNGFDTNPTTSNDNSGPTDGFLQTDDDDGLTVSFEFSEDETVVGSALIRWNIGEVQWLEASYPASGTGVVRIIDPDMNLNPESVDNFDVDVWSDSDAGGIDLTVTETNEATGIFEGTVFFTVADESSGHRLRVAEGDTVTAEYEDNTLPDPYTTADELDITATTLIGTVVPPLERAPAASLRTVDAFGNSLDAVSVDQQVQISADLANGQDREQSFAYLVQIQDGNGVTVSLAWITGSLSEGQSFSPALSWIPTQAGTYTATAFVWESVDNPTALSPPVSTTITVQ